MRSCSFTVEDGRSTTASVVGRQWPEGSAESPDEAFEGLAAGVESCQCRICQAAMEPTSSASRRSG